MNRKELANIIEKIAPLKLQAPWDNCGFNISLHDDIKKILVSLDLSEGILSEAASLGCDTVVTHHPVLFHQMKTVDIGHPIHKLVLKAVNLGLNVYCAHTSFDSSPSGTDAVLADILGIRNPEVLIREQSSPIYRFEIRNDPSNYDKIIRIVGTEIIDRSGDTIVFTHHDNSIVSQVFSGSTILSMKLENKYQSYGIGMIGDFEADPSSAVKTVKEKLGIDHVITNRAEPTVRRAACIGGSGGSYIKEAHEAGADLLITGEAKYNDYLDSESMGMMLIVTGHFDSEKAFIGTMVRHLQKNTCMIESIEGVYASSNISAPYKYM